MTNEGAPAGGQTSVTELRVRYAETDAMGVVYYANYFVWFELGRTDWIRAHGVSYREMEEQGIVLPVIDARCVYKASARYDDSIRLETTVTTLTPARIAFAYRVSRVTAGAAGAVECVTLLAEGATTHVFLGRDGRIARLNRHPALWQRLSSAFVAMAGNGRR